MSTTNALSTYKPSEGSSVFRKTVLSRLAQIESGTLELSEQGSSVLLGTNNGRANSSGPFARVTIHDPRVYQRIGLGGTLGAAESYIDGEWDTDDLTSLVRLILRSGDALNGIESGLARIGMLLARGWGALRRNTAKGSKRNISAHYDLGNEFFERMLDSTLMYSSGVFENQASTLKQASEHKLDLLCRMLELSADDELLEIGTGWGGLALHAARNFGASVTTTTISRQQHDLAQTRFEQAAVTERIELLMSDYRELTGQYDKLVSVEMIEAVGAAYYDTFFRKCDSLLAPGGLLALQSITIADQAYERHLTEVDFIKRYIFPGSNIPSLTALSASATRASTLRIREVNDYGLHYARTLAEWRRNLEPHKEWVVSEYGEPFWRMWMFYLAYCEAGFSERYISVKQVLLEKPKRSQS